MSAKKDRAPTGSRKRRPTVEDVARLAGVSVGTASQALNKRKGVAEATVARVQAVARGLNYHPSYSAQHLRRRQSNILTLHLLIPPDSRIHDSTWSFYYPIVQGFMSKAKSMRFRTHMEMNNLDEIVDDAYLEALVMGYQVYGAAFIIPYVADYSGVLRVSEIGCRTVTVYSRISDHVPSASTDDYTAARDVVRWLQSLGHAKIGFINGDEQHYSARERKKGYLEATAGQDDPMIFGGDWTVDSGTEGLKHFFGQATRPTAIFCANDHMALGVLKGCKELKIRVPDDLSLVGYDDNFICQVSDPELTTVRMPLQRMGEEAARMLSEQEEGAKGEKSVQHEVLPAELVVRKSVIALKQIATITPKEIEGQERG